MIIDITKNKKQTQQNINHFIIGGRNRDRTCDLLRVEQLLSQLSYPPNKNKLQVIRYDFNSEKQKKIGIYIAVNII